jgi:hypothetical protein
MPDKTMYVNKVEASAEPQLVYRGSSIPNVDVRAPFGRGDYESFRPNEAVPSNFKDSVRICRTVYKRASIVRQVIDLMTNFSCDGIHLEHSNLKVEAFFNAWFKKLNIKQISEEFARHALIDCNVIVKKVTAKMNTPVERQWVGGSPDVKINVDKEKTLTREIPVRYIFLDPLEAEWDKGSLSYIFGTRQLRYKLAKEVAAAVRANPSLAKVLPEDFRNNLDKSSGFNLDMSKIYVGFNKKDSWDNWATPMLVSVLPDIFYKDKLRLADLAALDGVINIIRIWKLGDHAKEIFPGELSFEKLSNAIQSHTGGGAIDIVWDSMIDMKEYYPPVDKILGPEKYAQVNQDILIGLGVPDVLLGGKGANFSNSFIQLKTIIERLQAIREMIHDWLSKDIEAMCNSFGIEEQPKIVFSNMNLYDENVSKQLMIQLFDRGILSDKSLLEQFDRDVHTEDARINEQMKKLQKSGREQKGPFSAPEKEAGDTGGRPPNSKDASRKTRKAKPKVSSSNIIEAISIVNTALDLTSSVYLEKNKISNLRKLTASQKTDLENLNLLIISCINLTDTIDKKYIANIIDNPDKFKVNETLVSSIELEKTNFVEKTGELPTIDQLKQIYAIELAKGQK